MQAKLNIGDVVKCFVKKITYFGIFVEVEQGFCCFSFPSKWFLLVPPPLFIY